MSAPAASLGRARVDPAAVAIAFIRRNSWALGLLVFLGMLLVFTRLIQPTYGASGIEGLAIQVLPLALAAAAQAVIVISGGIDLSIGSMMALTSVVAAANMKGQPEEFGVVVALVVLGLGMLLGAVNGILVVITRVPDIIVTLAMSFVWAGFALFVLRTPGGASSEWLKDIVDGSLLSEWIPKAAVVLALVAMLVWIPIQRSRLGISFYAIGSHQQSAFRSGVLVGRTKIMAYMVTGLFAALAGLSLTASTGIGTPVPGPYTLLSLAAVVLGGVSLAGGRGGLFGPIVAVVILTLLQTDMTFLKINSNYARVAQGIILVGVVMLGSIIQYRRSRK